MNVGIVCLFQIARLLFYYNHDRWYDTILPVAIIYVRFFVNFFFQAEELFQNEDCSEGTPST